MTNTTSYQWREDGWQPIAGIPLSDRGFRHGMSAFETVRIYNGRLVAMHAHLEKLRHACAQIGLREPPEILARFVPEVEHGTARIYVTAGDGSFRDPISHGRIVLLVEAASFPAPHSPVSLSLSPIMSAPLWPGLKTGNYWPHIAAFRSAGEFQIDEAVLINGSNHVVSASLANLFAVIDGLLLTPRVSAGARAGVMRDWIIAREDVIISDFHPEQLRGATEIFLSSSGFGVAPIATFEGKRLPSQRIGRELLSRYEQWLQDA